MQDAGVGIGNHDTFGAAFKHGGGQSQCLFGIFKLGDIKHDAAQGNRLSGADADADRILEPDHATVSGQHPVFKRVVAPAPGLRDAIINRAFAILRVNMGRPETFGIPFFDAVAVATCI